MKKLIPFLIALLVFAALGDSVRLGTLNKDSKVLIEGQFPLFQIWVPDGMTVTQIRASTNNFQNGFQLRVPSLSVSREFKCTGTKNGRPFYEAVNDPAITFYWSTDYLKWWSAEYALLGAVPGDDYIYPWDSYEWLQDGQPTYDVTLTQRNDDGKFVYRTCSTGQDADGGWGTGVSDPDPWIYFANQKGVSSSLTSSLSHMTLQKWISTTAEATAAGYSGTDLTAQLQPTGSAGHFITFQPSRSGNLGPDDWMSPNNHSLQWVVHYESISGADLHPDGSEVWSPIRPIEWNSTRLELMLPR